MRSNRELAKFDREGEREKLRKDLNEFREFYARVNGIVADALGADGWHRHRREWRRRRGSTMIAMETATTDPFPTWNEQELRDKVGETPEGIDEQRASGKKADYWSVCRFLKGNPAAIALWGDFGRHVLTMILKQTNPDDPLFQIAFLKFASDMRARLAGPDPTALELLLAERVVIAWAFANWADIMHVSTWKTQTIKQGEFCFKRIDLANRNLMAACRTLAKVKRSKLPEVLALVNATPPGTCSPDRKE